MWVYSYNPTNGEVNPIPYQCRYCSCMALEALNARLLPVVPLIIRIKFSNDIVSTSTTVIQLPVDHLKFMAVERERPVQVRNGK